MLWGRVKTRLAPETWYSGASSRYGSAGKPSVRSVTLLTRGMVAVPFHSGVVSLVRAMMNDNKGAMSSGLSSTPSA